ncbi:MAG: serine--tRNA ligase [Anaerolineae bacterium]|nr:serine--tRNA ligase [Anaerolineae bacterium]
MLDINLIREQPEFVKARLATRHDETLAARVDAILELDQRRRALLVQGETLQAERNKLNKALGRMKGNRNLSLAAQAYAIQEAVRAIQAEDFARAADLLANPPTDVPDSNAQPDLSALTEALRSIGDKVEALSRQAEAVEAEMREHMLWLPNLPHDSVPLGVTSEDNPVSEPNGSLPTFTFAPKPHWELGPALGIIDLERGAKLSGSRFYVLKGMGERLQRALINFCLDQHTANGYTELYLPFLVKEEMLYGAGQFPKFRNEIYTDPDAALYLLPTAEVAITNLHRDEILSAADLPLYYVANTPCWRREATSAGRDVRGIKRVHQFQKVELYKFTTPERSYAEHEAMRADVERLCAMLEIPYRVVTLCTGDLGFGMAKTYDIEMYAAGCGEWLEVSSISNAEAFQARRAMIRYRPESGGKVEYVHTLNGSGLAMPRVIIAILENFQQADGSVVVPKVLRPYMGGLEVITPR